MSEPTEPRPIDPAPDAPPVDVPAAPTDLAGWAGTMAWLGRAIVIAAVVATVTALVLVERLGSTYEDALYVTEQSAVLVADAIEPVRVMAGDLAELASTVAAGVEDGRTLAATTSTALDGFGDAATANLADSAEGAADVANRVADVFETIERLIPGDSQSVAEELRTFADGLDPLADQLRAIGEQAATAAGQLGDTDATLAELAARIEAIADDIVTLEPGFDTLAVTAADLRTLAADASDRLGADLWLLRILTVAGGVVVAAIGIATTRLAAALAAGRAGFAPPAGPAPGT